MQEIIAYIIVAIAIIALGIKIRKGMKQKSCGGGNCSGCYSRCTGCSGYSGRTGSSACAEVDEKL